MQKKQLFNKEEVDIILNCAEVEADNTDVGSRASEGKIFDFAI